MITSLGEFISPRDFLFPVGQERKEYMKKIITILLIVLALFTLTSCDKTNEDVIKVIDVKLTDESYAYAVKKGNTQLTYDFNIFLDEIKSNGLFDEIVAKYFEGIGEKVGVEYIADSNVSNDENTFVVATNAPFAPFEYIENGLFYGIDIEIAKAYADSKNQKLVVKNVDFDAIFENVNNGYADIGMAGITITEDRKKVNDFTNTYFEASQKLIVAVDNHDFDHCKTVSDVEEVLYSLENKKIGFQGGTTGNLYVEGNEEWGFAGFPELTPVRYKTLQLAIQDIADGKIYAAVGDEAPTAAMVKAINYINSSWEAKWEVFVNSIESPNFQKLILTGILNTILIAVLGLLIGIVIGTVIAIIKVAPKYKTVLKVLDKICTGYIAIFRGTPIVVQLLVAYYVLLPTLGIKGVEPLAVGIIVFGLNSAAYVAEIMRGGLNSVDKGQLEAGRALGLDYKTTLIKIIIPQAIKNILPTLGNEFISLIKETSVVSFITVIDLYTAFNTIGTNTYSVIIPYLVMALIYIVLVIIITILVKLMEKGLARSDRSN